MSGNSDKSDSWGSLVIDGIMTKMIQESGLRVVKSSDRNGDHKQGQKKAQQLPKKVFAEKDKDDFQQKSLHGNLANLNTKVVINTRISILKRKMMPFLTNA